LLRALRVEFIYIYHIADLPCCQDQAVFEMLEIGLGNDVATWLKSMEWTWIERDAVAEKVAEWFIPAFAFYFVGEYLPRWLTLAIYLASPEEVNRDEIKQWLDAECQFDDIVRWHPPRENSNSWIGFSSLANIISACYKRIGDATSAERFAVWSAASSSNARATSHAQRILGTIHAEGGRIPEAEACFEEAICAVAGKDMLIPKVLATRDLKRYVKDRQGQKKAHEGARLLEATLGSLPEISEDIKARVVNCSSLHHG
jgi:hypothetical protein